jgi:tetratricopeptide (TPR) repeat protein
MDFSWPSIALADLPIKPICGQDDLTPSDLEMLKGVSAYLAVVAHDYWELFATNVQVVDHSSRGIGISGVDEEGVGFEVAIEEKLQEIIRTIPNPFPVVGDFSRFVAAENKLLPLFMLGICAGLSPFSERNYGFQPVRKFKKRINTVLKSLAFSTARYYSEVFPDEPLGQDAELYLNNLIFPPMLMEEALPACAAMHGLLKYFDEHSVSQAQMLALAQNLSRMPDETLACVGLTLWSALEEEPTTEMIVLAEAQGRTMTMLRTARHQCLERLNKAREWIGVEELNEAQRHLFLMEYRLGFIPWLKLCRHRIAQHGKEPNLVRMLRCLVSLDARGAVAACDAMLAENKDDVQIGLQRAYLYFIQGRLDETQNHLSHLMQEPKAQKEARVYGLWGLLDVAFEFSGSAVEHLEQALTHADEYHLDRGEYVTNYAWALWINQQYQDALELVEKAIEIAPSPINAMLNRVEMLWQLKRIEEANMQLAAALELAPLHPRVFVHRVAAYELNL